MRTLLILLTCLFLQTLSTAQVSSYKLVQGDNTENLPYIVGSENIPGYQIEIHTLLANKVEKAKQFKNGKNAPVLQDYIANKKDYIGSLLENEKNEFTRITNITLVELGNTILFTVTGKDFSRSFTLETGTILTETDKVTVFHTKDIGIWKIYKK